MAKQLPSVKAYKKALKAFVESAPRMTKRPQVKLQMLANQYKSHDHALSQPKLANIGSSNEKRVPILYGQLGSFICKQLNVSVSPTWKALASRTHNDRYKLHPQMVQAISELIEEGVKLFDDSGPESPTLPNPPSNATPKEKEDYVGENMKAEAQIRVGQSQFRNRVLRNFNHKCCLTGIAEPDLLVASHIVPWRDEAYKDSRLDPVNGLCLSALHDRLFDKGYITFSNKLCVTITPRTPTLSEEIKAILEDIEGREATQPKKPIGPKFLKYHREKVFQKE